jgi:cytochrome c553
MKNIILTLIFISSLSMANGQELYKLCSVCHGETGKLQALHKSALIQGQESNKTIKQLTAYKNGELDQYGLGNIMNMQIQTLSEEDIQELAEYIAQLQ